MDTRELNEKLEYGRVTELGGLSTADQQRLVADPGLNRELELNQALRRSRPTAPESPAVAGQLSLAFQRLPDMDTTREDRGIMRSLLVGKKWYWQAAAVVLLIAVVVAIAALWPWRMSVTPGGINVGQETAWAAVEGFVVEFTIEFDEYYTGTAADSPDHPLWRIQALVDAWTAKHAKALAPYAAVSQADLQIERAWRQGSDDIIYQYEIRIDILTADRDLVDGLVELLQSIEHLSKLKIYNQEWFHSEKYPETRYVGREIIINGESLLYPQDINEDDLSLMSIALNVLPNEDGLVYYALDDIEEYRRYGLSDIVAISWEDDGAINIDNQPYQLDFSELGLPPWLHILMMYVPAVEAELDLDILDLMRKYAKRQLGPPDAYNHQGRRLVVDLLPRSEWFGIAEESLPGRISAPELAAAAELAADCTAALDNLQTDYPAAEECTSAEVFHCGGVPVQWVAEVTDRHAENLAQLLRDYLVANGATRIHAQPLLLKPGERSGGMGVQVSFKPQISIVVMLLPLEDEHGRDEHLAVKRASAEQKAQVTRDAGRLQQLVKEWNAGLPADGKVAPAEVRLHEVEGVPVMAWIGFDEDSDFVDDLADKLTAAGFDDVRINRPGPNYQISAETPVLYVWFFAPERFRGLAVDEVNSEFTAREFARARELTAAIESTVEAFNASYDLGVGMDGRDRQLIGGWPWKYGETPVGYGIPLYEMLPPAEEAQLAELVEGGYVSPDKVRPSLEDLYTELAGAGLPARESAEPWFYELYEPSPEDAEQWRLSGMELEKTVLWYHLPLADRNQVCAREYLPLIYTEDEQQAAADLLTRMQAALDDWLVGQPEGVEASLVANEENGVIQQIYVNCNRNDEDSVLSLAEALAVEGAPVYLYGSGFSNRHAQRNYARPPELREINVTQARWMLLPQVRLTSAMGGEDDEASLREEFTPEELEQARDARRIIQVVYTEWLEQHPELAEPLGDEFGSSMRKAYMPDIRWADFNYIVCVNICLDDEAAEQKLAEELVALVEEAGVDIKPLTDRRTDLVTVFRSGSVGQGTGSDGKAGVNLHNLAADQRDFTVIQISWNVLPQVRFLAAMGGEDFQEKMRKEFTPEELEQAKADAGKIKRAYLEWVELHPELAEPIAPELERMLKAQYNFNRPEGEIVYQVNVHLYENDAERAQELIDELGALVAATGVDIELYTMRRTQSLPVRQAE